MNLETLIGRFGVLILILCISSCNGDQNEEIRPTKKQKLVWIDYPNNLSHHDIGEGVEVKIRMAENNSINTLQIDFCDSIYVLDPSKLSQNVIVTTAAENKVGYKKLILNYADETGNLYIADQRDLLFFSDITPEYMYAEIVKIFPHDKRSYTQGMEFYKNQLYEGTGQYGQSVLSQVDLNTGNRLKTKTLEDEVFGEGITILKDTIYQLTYRSGKCYVYDLSFNLIQTHYYYNEGWGLCNDGKQLLMSNGSSIITYRDPHSFQIMKQLEVMDDSQQVSYLNELELINGYLYANIYRENRIAKIDTATGKVMAYIDCRDVALNARDLGNDVLNGIAHNELNGKTYITGKWWNKLYEVNFRFK